MSITLKSLLRPRLYIPSSIIGIRPIYNHANIVLKNITTPSLRSRILNSNNILTIPILSRTLSYSISRLKHFSNGSNKGNFSINNNKKSSIHVPNFNKHQPKFSKIKPDAIGTIVSGKGFKNEFDDHPKKLREKKDNMHSINDKYGSKYHSKHISVTEIEYPNSSKNETNKDKKNTVLPTTTTATITSVNLASEVKIANPCITKTEPASIKDSSSDVANQINELETSQKIQINSLLGSGSHVNHSFFQKIKENIKWFLIRNKNRPFSKDELGTLFSWLFISQIVWLVLKTTTVVSLLLLTFNTVFAKELVAQTIGKLINYFSEDISINFQDALIPEWKSGFIKFKDVRLNTNKNQENDILEFHLVFHEIEINLSLRKWLQGKGLINDIKVFGIRGETVINYKENKKIENSQELLLDWFSNPNYKLMNVNISDCKFNVIENFADKSEPTNVKIRIFNLDISGLRFNQLLTDFLKANVITGSINNSLFTFHKRQHKLSYMGDMKNDLSSWDRITRLRLNSINVNTLGLNKTRSFNWIEDGDVDLVADIMLPQETDDSDLQDNDRYLLLDLRFKFKDLKASLPKIPPTLSTGEQIISLDELKPVISFVNLQRILSRSNNYTNNEINNILVDENDEHSFSKSTPNVSIKRKRSYPNITVIQSDTKKANKENETDLSGKANNATSIIKFHPTHSSNQPYNTVNSYNSSSEGFDNKNELMLHCRLVKNIKDLERVILFEETGIYDQICMELYVDLIKTVEEWEFKNKDEWMKEWGTTFASQLLLFGFTNVM